MCGIAGIVMKEPVSPDRSLLKRMADSLRHRGPDDEGIEISGRVGFAFRRLAILDLSPAGHQPMVSADGHYCVMFNGEIYNYLELRDELEKRGHVFNSRSDTEVLLHIYAEKGTEAFQHLNGMFAIAIHDRRKQRVILVRDRMGKKPLFYWQGPFGLAFASELRALRLLPGFPSDLDPEALGLFVRLGWIPNSHCIYPGVRKLPPSTWIEYDCASSRLSEPRSYWELPPPRFDESLTEEEWLDRIETMLAEATRIRLRSDVPLGVFLSGGIDSGLVAASACKTRAGLTGLTIGFDEQGYDETDRASATAKHLGLRHVKRKLRLAEARTLLPEVVGHFDEPFADSSALPTNLVCAEARKDFTVVLSGDGGDEVFAGYQNHVRAWQWRHVDRIPLSLRRIPRAVLVGLGPPDSLWRRVLHRLGEPVATFGLGGKVYPFQDWQETVIAPEFNLDPRRAVRLVAETLSHRNDCNPLDEAQRFDMRLYMRDDILVKVDRMSMFHALEVRSPFLDHRIVELALRVPPRFRVRNGQNKYMLRRLGTRLLPPAVATGPKKGFAVPLQQWFFGNDGKFFKEFLLEHDSRFPPLFRPGGAEKLWGLAMLNGVLVPALFTALAYRWWCAAQA